MSGINKAILVGRLGSDPEVRYTPGGDAVANFSVATSEEWKDKNQYDTYLGYKEKVSDKLTLNTKYKYTFRHYTDNPDETNAVRKSMSVGFDYQF